MMSRTKGSEAPYRSPKPSLRVRDGATEAVAYITGEDGSETIGRSGLTDCGSARGHRTNACDHDDDLS